MKMRGQERNFTQQPRQFDKGGVWVQCGGPRTNIIMAGIINLKRSNQQPCESSPAHTTKDYNWDRSNLQSNQHGTAGDSTHVWGTMCTFSLFATGPPAVLYFFASTAHARAARKTQAAARMCQGTVVVFCRFRCIDGFKGVQLKPKASNTTSKPLLSFSTDSTKMRAVPVLLLLGALISVSGQSLCGPKKGNCPDGLCCSRKGVCGTDAKSCRLAKGCRREYGTCWTPPGRGVPASPAPISGPISSDGLCGVANGGKLCPAGNCCSSLGWCGASDLHCGVGCQSAYGLCGAQPSAAVSAAASPAASPAASAVPSASPASASPLPSPVGNEMCGPTAGDMTCLPGMCTSASCVHACIPYAVRCSRLIRARIYL